jgi:hypothetical protein
MWSTRPPSQGLAGLLAAGVDVALPAGFSPDVHAPPEARGEGVGGVFITWQAHGKSFPCCVDWGGGDRR